MLSVSFGFTAAVDTVLVPSLLRQHGIAVNRIADVVAIALILSVWNFLISPLADTGLRRRIWVLLAAVIAALAASLAVIQANVSLALLTTLLFLSHAAAALHGIATGGLMTLSGYEGKQRHAETGRARLRVQRQLRERWRRR